MEYSERSLTRGTQYGPVSTSKMADSMHLGLLPDSGLRALQQRSRMGGSEMDPSQIIVYAILWTFCFAVTVYALVSKP
jgi:hypothetical protein